MEENFPAAGLLAKFRPKSPFLIQIQLDFLQLLLTILSLSTRCWLIGSPRAVVFDELHFLKFVSLYMKKTFFFDIHPPLGKQLLAFAGYCAGFDGNLSVTRIGADLPSSVPITVLRLVPAIFGSLIVPVVYEIAVELGLSYWAALFAASFVLLDNALLVQSRFMLMESMLIFFSCLTFLSYLKFRNLTHGSSCAARWFWMMLTAVCLSSCVSIKYSGVLTALFVLCLAIKDYWSLLDNLQLSEVYLLKEFVVRVAIFLIVPTVLYIGVFFVHLVILTRAGDHNGVLSSAFQASLDGGLATLTRGQSLYIAFGSKITLRHAEDVASGRPCWLHSHAHVYPLRYPDGRGSSYQQQVTCYAFKDTNNWWIVKHPARSSLLVGMEPTYVKHGDVIQLIHGTTNRVLNSHDVAAPLSPENQEVSCYVDYNVSMAAKNLWRVGVAFLSSRASFPSTFLKNRCRGKSLRTTTCPKTVVVEILNRQDGDDLWQTIQSRVRLHHIETSSVLRAQIHLLGNMVVWVSSSISVIVFLLLASGYYICYRRSYIDEFQGDWVNAMSVCGILVGGYLCHWLPYLATDRTLFLHCYLPSVTFKILNLAALLDHLSYQHCRWVQMSLVVPYLVVTLLSMAAYNFMVFLPVTFGTVDLTATDIHKLKWRESWEFLSHSEA